MHRTTAALHAHGTLATRRPLEVSLVWVALGALFVLLQLYCYGSWIGGDSFTPNTYGREDVPQWLRIWIRSIEVISVSLFAWCNYKFLYQPWRRTGQISFDGLIILACSSIFWQDTAMNYSAYYAQLNTYFTNFGSWYNFFPGWMTPNAERMPEAIIAWGASYASWFVLLPVLAGNWFLTWCKTRKPHLSQLELIGLAFLFLVAIDFCVELPLVLTTTYTYAGALKALSLFPDEVYRFPLYEPVLWGAVLTAFTCLYHYRDDRGFSWAERGVSKLELGGRSRKFLRYLALSGVFNIIFLVYNGIMILLSLHGDAWPEGVPRYLNAGLCGDDSAYTCPSPDLPWARDTAITNRILTPEQLDAFLNTPRD
jgi:hypothetical protein